MTKRNVIFLKGEVPIEIIAEPYCQKCMNPYPKEDGLCDNCRNPLFEDDNWHFNEVKALGIYHNFKSIPINILTVVVNILKFRRQKSFKNYAGRLIADGLFQLTQFYPKLIKDLAYITTIPKFNTTEINQCDFILNPLIKKLKSRGLDIHDISDKVVRLIDIGEHKYRNFYERYDKIKGIHRVDTHNLENNKVLIIDDIFTTGSTVWDLARALKKKNAGEINIMVAGRHYQYNDWPVFEGLNFDDLLLYFSYLDMHRDRKKIDYVQIKKIIFNEYKQIHSLIEGSTKDYHLIIDFEKKILKHDCTDFLADKKWDKRFCKHITKTFLQIREKFGLERAQNSLNSIYQYLDEWSFEQL